MPLVIANNVQHHVQVLGEGPPVGMIHGLLTGSLASWFYTTAPVLAQSNRVLLYDLRGHGRSARPTTGYDTDTLMADLSDITASFAGPMTLVGHSYGALIALRYALHFPERVNRLVLVETPLPPSRMDEFTHFVTQTPEAMLKALPFPMQSVVASGGESRRARRLLESLHFLTSECSLIQDVLAEPDVSDDALGTLDCPVLAIHGDQSALRPVGQRLSQAINQCTLVELPGGHYLPLECPKALTETIVGFCHG